jgi:hypothetical protein
VDPTDQFETGVPVTWKNTLVLRNRLFEQDGQRKVELTVSPRGAIRYTLDGSEPHEGTAYAEPVPISDGDLLMRTYAEADGIETKEDFRFTARTKKGVDIDPAKPVELSGRSVWRLDARAATYSGLADARERGVTFRDVNLTVGQGSRVLAASVGDVHIEAVHLEDLLNRLSDRLEPDAAVTMTFRRAHFPSGHDFVLFMEKLGLKFIESDVTQ